ncbi:hypothetical protein ISTM_435 [Insectomime virus]|nr:hypothetical protein ISTM_435 [Insectomime virus]
MEEQVSEILEKRYFLKRCEFVIFDKPLPNDPFHTTLFRVYTKWSDLLCEWEELRLDDTIGYYEKGQLGLSLTEEEMLQKILCQLYNCKRLNGIHKGLLEYELKEKRKALRRVKRLKKENARLRQLVRNSELND